MKTSPLLRLVGAAALSALAAFATPALSATPKDTLVMAWAIDDIITLDPAEAFEISAGEIMGNTYDRLLRFDVNDPSKLIGDSAPELDRLATTARPIPSSSSPGSSSPPAIRSPPRTWSARSSAP